MEVDESVLLTVKVREADEDLLMEVGETEAVQEETAAWVGGGKRNRIRKANNISLGIDLVYYFMGSEWETRELLVRGWGWVK